MAVDPASVSREFVGDRRILKRVLGNLLKNAARGFPPGRLRDGAVPRGGRGPRVPGAQPDPHAPGGAVADLQALLLDQGRRSRRGNLQHQAPGREIPGRERHLQDRRGRWDDLPGLDAPLRPSWGLIPMSRPPSRRPPRPSPGPSLGKPARSGSTGLASCWSRTTTSTKQIVVALLGSVGASVEVCGNGLEAVGRGSRAAPLRPPYLCGADGSADAGAGRLPGHGTNPDPRATWPLSPSSP